MYQACATRTFPAVQHHQKNVLNYSPPFEEIRTSPQKISRIRRIPLQSTAQLNESFSLRFQVYCRECNFLSLDNYLDELESDHFDLHSLHFGTVDEQNVLLGSVRLVQWSSVGLPLQHYWSDIIPKSLESKSAEISRLVLSRQTGRNTQYQLADAETHRDEAGNGGNRTLNSRLTITMELYIALYQAAKRQGFTHLFSAMEPRLARLMRRYNFPFIPIGPAIDYYGCVKLYSINVKEWGKSLLANNPRLYLRFEQGLQAPPKKPLNISTSIRIPLAN